MSKHPMHSFDSLTIYPEREEGGDVISYGYSIVSVYGEWKEGAFLSISLAIDRAIRDLAARQWHADSARWRRETERAVALMKEAKEVRDE